MGVCVIEREIEGVRKRVAYGEKFNKFIMCVSNNLIILLVVSHELIYAHYVSLVYSPSGNLPSMPLEVLCNLTFTILH